MTNKGTYRLLPLAHALGNETHVWLVNPDTVDSPAVLEHYRSLLSREELDRYRRYHFMTHRRLYLVSHALVRLVLSRYAEVSPADWCFSTGSHGRPELQMPGFPFSLRFNLSHTTGLAAVIVTRELDCGIDVEQVNAQRDINGIAKRIFPEQECLHLDRLGAHARVDQFFAYWTLHEAYSKALGTGITGRDNRCTFLGEGVGNYRLNCKQQTDIPGEWLLSVLQPAPGYLMAVAVRGTACVAPGIKISWLVE